jgi:hypothetical protein
MYTAIIDALPGILPRTRPDSYRIDVRAYVRAERRTPKDIRRMASLVDLSSGRISFAVIAFETITDKDYILRTAEDELAGMSTSGPVQLNWPTMVTERLTGMSR